MKIWIGNEFSTLYECDKLNFHVCRKSISTEYESNKIGHTISEVIVTIIVSWGLTHIMWEIKQAPFSLIYILLVTLYTLVWEP
jgi:hypothetical protein